MSVVEERKVKIPTCKIDMTAVREICELIENEANNMREKDPDSYIDLNFKVESKGKDIMAHTTESFLNARWPRQIKNIDIRYYGPTKYGNQRIYLNLDFESMPSSKFSVEGTDPTWVNGITARMEEIFNHRKNRNYIFRDAKYLLPIVAGIAFALALGTQMISDLYYVSETPNSYPNKDTIYISLPYVYALFVFFRWLFPQIEFEDYLIQTKIRKALLAILGIIIMGLLVSGLSKFIFG